MYTRSGDGRRQRHKIGSHYCRYSVPKLPPRAVVDDPGLARLTNGGPINFQLENGDNSYRVRGSAGERWLLMGEGGPSLPDGRRLCVRADTLFRKGLDTDRYVRKSDIIRLKEQAINRRVNAGPEPYHRTLYESSEFARIVPANATVPITLGGALSSISAQLSPVRRNTRARGISWKSWFFFRGESD